MSNLNPLSNLDLDPHKGISGGSTVTIPGLISAASTGSGNSGDYRNYRVRYQKINLDDLGDISELERLETLAIHDRGVYILSKERFVMQATGTVVILLNYLEKIPDSEQPVRPSFFAASATSDKL